MATKLHTGSIQSPNNVDVVKEFTLANPSNPAFKLTLDTTGLSTNRQQSFQDASGIIALTTDIPATAGDNFGSADLLLDGDRTHSAEGYVITLDNVDQSQGFRVGSEQSGSGYGFTRIIPYGTTNSIGSTITNGVMNLHMTPSSSIYMTNAGSNGRVGINTTTLSNGATFQVDSTDRGFLPPRNADPTVNIGVAPNVVAGVMAYNSTSNRLEYFNGTIWKGISVESIYTNDDSLTGNRILSMTTNTLTFGSTGDSNLLTLDSVNDKVGVGVSSPTAKLEVVGDSAGSTVFKVDGTLGELFTITDNLTGTLFTVNNISGLPILRVEDNDYVIMGKSTVPSGHTTEEVNTLATSGNYVLATVDISAYNMVIFDYVIKDNSLGNNCRAGSVTATWDNSNNVEYVEVSTPDLGTTTDLQLSASITSGNIELIGTKGVSAITWNVKTIIRAI